MNKRRTPAAASPDPLQPPGAAEERAADGRADAPGGGAEQTELSFESALAELESLVEEMEGGELALEQALRSFERGMKLQSFCQAALEKAEQKVRILTGEDDTEDGLTPFAADE